METASLFVYLFVCLFVYRATENTRVVTRYVGSGIKGLKRDVIRDHSPGIWDHNPRDRDQRYFHSIKDQAFWITKGIHDAHLDKVF